MTVVGASEPIGGRTDSGEVAPITWLCKIQFHRLFVLWGL